MGKAGGSSPPGTTDGTEGLPDWRRGPVANRVERKPCGFNSRSFRWPLRAIDGDRGVGAARQAVNLEARVQSPSITLTACRRGRTARHRPRKPEYTGASPVVGSVTPVAHRKERGPAKPEAAGSIPARSAATPLAQGTECQPPKLGILVRVQDGVLVPGDGGCDAPGHGQGDRGAAAVGRWVEPAQGEPQTRAEVLGRGPPPPGRNPPPLAGEQEVL